MPFVRARPRIRLRAPKEIVPGVPFELEARLESKRAIDIEWCDLRIEGHEVVTAGDGQKRVALLDPRVARLCGPRTLAPGVTSLSCRAELPAGLPPSFVGVHGRIVYEAHAHASLDWWPDARGSFSLAVTGPFGADAPSPVGLPRVTASRADGPLAEMPYLEVSLASDVVEIGGEIEGAISLRSAGRSRKATVRIAAYETASGHGAARGVAYELALTLPDVPDGSAIPFAMRLPADATPSFVSKAFRVSHWLEVDLRGALSSIAFASMPVRIVPKGRGARGTRTLTPHVGDARLAALFEAVANARGHAVENGPTLVLHRNGIEGRIERSTQADGTHLVLTARYPSFQLGLSVYPAGVVQQLVSGQVRSGDEVFDSGHVIRGREREQAGAFVLSLGEVLSGLLVRMDDESLNASARTNANERGGIERFVERAERIMDALVVSPPMPAVFAEVVEEWRALARWLGGTLEPGHARIRANYASSRVEVTTRFVYDTPASTMIEITPELPTAAELDIKARGDVEGLRGVPAEAVTLLDRLARSGSIEVRARFTRITIDAPLAGPFSPKKVRPIVETVLRLHDALKPTRGPFR